MKNRLIIEELHSVADDLNPLSELLIKVVDEGASIGFLPPMKHATAEEYWNQVLVANVILFVAMMDDEIVGSIQLHLCTKENGLHRAEIAKLITSPDYRRQGIGRRLMEKAEERARLEGRTLLVLDTRVGDPSNLLYQSIGFTEAGRIPYYAKSANGELQSSVFYYKVLF